MTICRLSQPTCMLLLVFTILSSQIAVNAKTPRSEIVPFEQWNCGASDFDRSLSHQLSKEDCPKRMYEADLCCVVHDICYMDEHTSQSDCDAAFCHCLDRTVAQTASRAASFNQTGPNGCDNVSNSFCEIVKLLGGMAFATARQTLQKQRKALAEWDRKEAMAKNGASSTSTAPPSLHTSASMISSTSSPALSTTATSSSTIGTTTSSPSTTPSPADIRYFVTHKFPLACLDNSLSKCTKQLQKCTTQHFNAAASAVGPESGDSLVLGAQLAECSAQFCECASQQQVKEAKQSTATSSRWILSKSVAKEGDECALSLAAICTQFGDMPKGPNMMNFWSVNVNYISQPFSLMLAMVGSIFTLLLFAFLGFFLLKLAAFIKRRLQQDESIRKNYTKASIRRNTLTALRGFNGENEDVEHGRPHYIPFGHQKESTVSSPSAREPAAQKLLPNGHKKTHSDIAHVQHNKNLLNSPNNKLPLNSSQVHLIAGSTGNSSSTLSDISSA